MTKRLFILLFICPLLGFTQPPDSYPATVKIVLTKAGKNKMELEKAINYFNKSGDALKLKAVYFLIANMDIHSSADYYWADAKGNKIVYNEFNYSDFNTATKAAGLISAQHPGAHMVPVMIPDITIIKGDFLIDHINRIFVAWKTSWAKNISFNDFCEYILPYRVSVEPLQNWTPTYTNRFKWFKDGLKANGIQKELAALSINVNTWFINTNELESRKEPLPRLGAMQLLFRKKGPCEDVADLSAYILRSQGVPVALDVIPYWATSTGSHFTTSVFDPQMHTIRFDLSRIDAISNNAVPREPSKVIRVTYSKQPGTLAGFEKPENIPDGFMQTVNYKDVTADYWPTTNVTCPLLPNKNNSKIVYAYIFNGLRWRPTWWGIKNGNSVTFKNMSKGVVYLPAYYKDKKLMPAGYPLAEGYHHEMSLAPDLNKRISIVLKQESGYLTFKPGKRYKLYYWDNRWQFISQQVANLSTSELLFSNVPKNSLLLLLPEYSQKKERPFMITDDGKRNWF